MAVLNDADQFSDSATDNGSSNVYIDPTARTIKLVSGQGGLVAKDGAILSAIYSFAKEEWILDPNDKKLAAKPFPFIPITDEFYELSGGWDWADTATRNMVRRGGWAKRNSNGAVIEWWAAAQVLNALPTDQITYDIGAGATPFTFTGNTAEAIQVISDPDGNGNYSDGFNYSQNLVGYNREQGQEFSSASTQAAGEASLLAPKLFGLGLPTGTDLKITASDAVIESQAPYTGMSITFYNTPQARTIGSNSREFGIIINANGGNRFQIYEYLQWALRQSTDQDQSSGTLLGNVMPQLAEFVGETLKTLTALNYRGGGNGVFIDNFDATQTNDLVFIDNTGASRTFPFVAAGNLIFNSALQNDPDAVYNVFFADNVTSGEEYGGDNAILVNDNAGVPLSGSVNGAASIPFTYDYDGNVQGGRSAGQDVNLVAMAVGKSGAQFVVTTSTIVASNGNSINFVAPTERNAKYD